MPNTNNKIIVNENYNNTNVNDDNNINYKTNEFMNEGEVDLNNANDDEKNPEDEIPDLPENAKAREFLKKAPRKGLFMPLGIQVKVMQCWRCKAYGHRTGDQECPMRISGNSRIETIRQCIEDPMMAFVETKSKERREKYERVEQLKVLMEEIRHEENIRKMNKKRKHDIKKKDNKHKTHKKDKH